MATAILNKAIAKTTIPVHVVFNMHVCMQKERKQDPCLPLSNASDRMTELSFKRGGQQRLLALGDRG